MIYLNTQKDTYVTSLSNLRSSLSIGFTTKKVGDCRKISVIQDYFKYYNLHNNKLVLLEQIHSANITNTNQHNNSKIEQLEESDGVISLEKNVILVVRVADCLPVIYFSLKTGCIGAAHIGWRGTLKNLMGKMIENIKNIGSESNDIYIIIGPAINQCCYEIDVDAYGEFMSVMERYSKVAFKPHGQKFRLNLERLNYELALESGIDKTHIDYFPFCTSCNSDHFFSYRRDYKKNSELFGEMMGYITVQ
ncbi:peptidoglycan editing factor PgeF [Candidatus Roizmanbacteria bacterium CG_4_10_14_0_8_um_filter_33_9]|uniref:Purine nucleoside phosphorylase n=1 Tax=Candidatus Roizmanbacteria bacterium CG_4_10_14_0_8_um_filter_33_9 TaxID=1974826 RepID=A0A2M7QHI5_9BACT|nr:MAG: peptidoglycan editing factor PgeF [Candidatus Roizmanbacteria bacterium CG_4_10_14_0_8_um_filter_33_9]